MVTNITETLTLTDFEATFAAYEARGEARGEVNSRMEIALKAFKGLVNDKSTYSDVENLLKTLDIPEDIIEAAYNQVLA